MAKKSKADKPSIGNPFEIFEYKKPELKLNDKKAQALTVLLKDDYFKDRLGCDCGDLLKAYNSGKRSK
jgi:hypothetical protein